MHKPDNDPAIPYRFPVFPYPNPNDGVYLDKMKVYAKLMAEMIPPLSSPAGGMRLKKFDNDITNPLLNPNPLYHRGINLMNYRNTDLWPLTRPKKTERQQLDQRWLHGDYKDAPYLLTHPLYKKVKEITQGEQQ